VENSCSFTAVPSPVSEGHGGMLNRMYGEGESREKPDNSGSPGRMAVKLACVVDPTLIKQYKTHQNKLRFGIVDRKLDH